MNKISTHLALSFSYLPARKLKNSGLAIKHTGIRTRRYANEIDAASDLVIKVLFPIIHNELIRKSDIGALLVATTSGDVPSPATAHAIHKKLALRNEVHCLDIASSCSSFLSALRCVSGFLSSEKSVLVIATEVKHKHIANNNMRVLSLFADGAGGVYLQNSQKKTTSNDMMNSSETHCNSNFIFAHTETNSEFFENICTPVGGSQTPATTQNISQNTLQFLNPKNMYIHTVKALVHAVESLLEHTLQSYPNSRLGLIFIHQANQNILQDVQNRLPQEIAKKIPILISDVGNMACASLPVLRTRVLFLQSLVHFHGSSFQKADLIKIFTVSCQMTDRFSYQLVSNGILFKSVWKNETVCIFDDGCDSLSESWLAHICPIEFENLMQIFLLETQNKTHDSYDFWIAAGGGFQTIGMIHNRFNSQNKN